MTLSSVCQVQAGGDHPMHTEFRSRVAMEWEETEQRPTREVA